MKLSFRSIAMLLPFVAAIPAHAQERQPDAVAPAAQVALPTAGAANINITPRRVIFDRSKRTEAVFVFNQGNTPVTVDVALVDNAMLPSGEIVPISRIADHGPAAEAVAAKVRSAKPFVLAAPSRLTLPPGQGRTIRVRATLADGATSDEFRTHLTVTTVPAPDAGLTAEQAAAAEKGELVLRIQSVFGISIPLIVRSGSPDATGAIGSMAVAQTAKGPVLSLALRRKGATSLYGNVEVRSGKELVGIVRGIAVYPELDERIAQVPLLRPLKRGETVTATFIADDAKQAQPVATGTLTAS